MEILGLKVTITKKEYLHLSYNNLNFKTEFSENCILEDSSLLCSMPHMYCRIHYYYYLPTCFSL